MHIFIFFNFQAFYCCNEIVFKEVQSEVKFCHYHKTKQ